MGICDTCDGHSSAIGSTVKIGDKFMCAQCLVPLVHDQADRFLAVVRQRDEAEAGLSLYRKCFLEVMKLIETAKAEGRLNINEVEIKFPEDRSDLIAKAIKADETTGGHCTAGGA